MNKTTLAAALLLAAPTAALAALERDARSLSERHFRSGWTQVDPGALAEPAPPTAVPAEPAPGPDKPVHDEHSTVGHMFITRVAYELYAARYGGGELARFIGDYEGGKPSSDKHDTVVAGAFEEDSAFLNPFNDLMSFNRHFWDYKKGDYAGWAGFDSSVNRAHKYWTGGYAIDGKYDKGWSGNQGKHRGIKGLGAVSLYRNGDKAKAYWYLGHVAHLVEDLTVPAHNHLWAHPFHNSDMYESYMGDHHTEWGELPPGPVESFGSLYDIFRKTAEITHGYDAGSGPGPLGKDGDLDKGRRRKARFTEELLKEEGRVLMPLAYRRVAALFVHFYKQVDHAAPRVTLDTPSSADPAAPDRASVGRLILTASAVDDQSGVDKESFGFEYRRWKGGAWSAWRPVSPAGAGGRAEFAAPPDGGLFSFRATASDAAGNTGRSEERFVRFELPELAGAPAPRRWR